MMAAACSVKSYFTAFVVFTGLVFAPYARAEDTIKIASIFSLTGIAAKTNAHSVSGVRIGVREINQKGGILGRKIELIEIDNKSTPIGSKIAAVKAVRANVAAIIGAAWSSHSIAIAAVAQANGIPMITNVSTHTKVTRIGNCIFRACFNDAFQGQIIAKFTRKDLKADSCAIFVDITSDFSMELAKEFGNIFEKKGGKILRVISYKQKPENYREPVSELKNINPDVVFIPGYDESALIINEIRKLGISTIPVGGDGWDTNSFFLNGGNKIDLGYYCTHWSAELKNKRSKRFVKRYKTPDGLHASATLGYDAVFLIADAIRRAGSAKKAKIRNALANTKNFRGVTGTISFDASGEPLKNAVMMKIVNGQRHFLKSIQP